jgi:hypothetical protein
MRVLCRATAATTTAAVPPANAPSSESKDAAADPESNEVANPETAKPQAPRRFWLFHLIMLLGSIYIAMVFTNWQVKSTGYVSPLRRCCAFACPWPPAL